ncbi:hypothetical protein DFQ01_12661 [Paenibacillus cellulosilyticus]|uniref:Uncharacterized protein n=1 Tax=Paenibacillus cellulosilyticus TaxID=375489 RepID=A0A2V2YMH9_9BACL|nr:hypothetical protein [Paenibacillus cellulosilyticus]PWV95590.1 hypothetical protein DFQ01_12661 [Paenibacillus cellulosilyticus]QKS47339.1 hypothetical protein HUB94_23340 [Paenibacillus cellulosilyticus]
MRSILVFVLFAAMLCWMMFSPIYKHILIVRQAALQQEVDYLLEIGANGSHGYIDAAMIAESKARLAALGLKSADIIYTVASTDGTVATSASAPLLRGTGLSLTISYPYEGLFTIDQLVGIEPPPSTDRMSARGMKMSEYVP